MSEMSFDEKMYLAIKRAKLTEGQKEVVLMWYDIEGDDEDIST